MNKSILLLLLLLCVFSKSNSQNIVINEVVASNNNVLKDENGEFYDWIEIYNYGNETVNLNKYGLSDDFNKPFKWIFPNINIKPKEYIVVFASGNNIAKIDEPLHTNFSIDSDGEEIVLTHPKKGQISVLKPTKIPSDVSFGKYPDGVGEWFYFVIPTPNSENNTQNFRELLSPPIFSKNSGFYTSQFYLKVKHLDSKVVIRYTLDGSTPNENSSILKDSILIVNRTSQPNKISAIPTTLNNDFIWCKWLAPMDLVFKCTNLRVRAFKKGAINPYTETKVFFVDKNIFKRYDIPIISISINQEDLFNANGLFKNFDARGDEWEKSANITYFEKGGFAAFSTEVGIRLHGGNSRKFAQKSFKIYFRDKYGLGLLKYPIFPEQSNISYESLILRNGGSDWNQSFIRDVFVQSILKNYSDVSTQANRPVIVFLNGEYWGLMQLKERYDKNYIKQHFDCKKFDLLRDSGKIIVGTNTEYFEFIDFLKNNDISKSENYKYVETQLDINNVIDYYILQVFVMNTDQPGKNVFYWKSNTSYGKWRFMFYDLDDSFGFGSHNNFERNGLVYNSGLNNIQSKTVNTATPPPSWAPNTPERTFLFRTLLQNEEFKFKFINRFADLLNTAFQPVCLQNKIDSIYSEIEKYMNEQYRRWHRPSPNSLQVQIGILKNFAKNRIIYQRKHILSFFNIKNEVKISLTVSSDNQGFIRINSININNSTPCFLEKPYLWSGIYFEGIPIEIEAISYEGYYFKNWNDDITDTNPIKVITPHQNIVLKANFKSVF